MLKMNKFYAQNEVYLKITLVFATGNRERCMTS